MKESIETSYLEVFEDLKGTGFFPMANVAALRRIYWIAFRAYVSFFHSLNYYLAQELKDCNSVLDLGCGSRSPIRHYPVSYTLGVERFQPSLERSKTARTHTDLIRADITSLEFKEKSFDAVVALWVFEHLGKEEGYRLLPKWESWAKKKIILSTTNGFRSQEIGDDNPLLEHISGWDVTELEKMGFEAYGLGGPKKLCHPVAVRILPNRFWQVYHSLMQRLTYHKPGWAIDLLCIKRLVR